MEERDQTVQTAPVHEEFRRVDTQQTPDFSGLEKKDGASKPLLLLLGLIVLLAIGATGYLLKDKFTKPEPTPTPTPVLETPVEEQPTPTSVFDRSKFTLRVLNGTKTSGLAASISAKLKDIGYSIDKSGNATNSAFTKTIVRVKKDSSTGLLEQIVKDLIPDYRAEDGGNLKDSDDVDAEVILGAE